METPTADLAGFIAAVRPGGRVLDLGCGPGQSAEHMVNAGLDTLAMDASPEMIALASARLGPGARIGTFDDIAGTGPFDGVWASFSLLHAAPGDLPRHLTDIARELRPGGVFFIAMKVGEGHERDAIGRLYTYVTPEALAEMLEEAGFEVVTTRQGREKGLAGTLDPYVTMLCRKSHA